MKGFRIFLTWSGAIAWLLALGVSGYLWLGGYLYAKSAPLFDALVCAESPSLHFTLDGSGPYRPPSCVRGIYARGASADVSTFNSDPKYLYAVLSLPEDGEAEKMTKYWIARGANINIQSTLTGATVLELFAKNGDTDAVDTLLKNGARLDLRNKAGQTVLESVRAYDEKLGRQPNVGIMKLLGG